MKKIVILFLILSIAGCSKKNDEINKSESSKTDSICIAIDDNVKIFEEKKITSKILKTISKNTKVEFLKAENENDLFRDLELPKNKDMIIYWIYVKYEGIKGYVDSIQIYPLSYASKYKNIFVADTLKNDNFGFINGLVQYPSEGIPLNMIIGAEDIDNQILYLSKNYQAKSKDVNYHYICNYNLKLPAGNYKIFYNFPFGNEKSFKNNYQVFYTGFESNYDKKYEPKIVKITNGKALYKIDPSF